MIGSICLATMTQRHQPPPAENGLMLSIPHHHMTAFSHSKRKILLYIPRPPIMRRSRCFKLSLYFLGEAELQTSPPNLVFFRQSSPHSGFLPHQNELGKVGPKQEEISWFRRQCLPVPYSPHSDDPSTPSKTTNPLSSRQASLIIASYSRAPTSHLR